VTPIRSLGILRFIFFSFTAAAQPAAQCSPIRLDAPGKPLHDLPVFNQGKTALCEAYTAALAIDSALFYDNGNRSTRPITSPIALAARYSARAAYDQLDGPTVETIIKNVSIVGVCDHDDITRQLLASPKVTSCRELQEWAIDNGGIAASKSPNSLPSCGFELYKGG
jgi:hypothetical protein